MALFYNKKVFDKHKIAVPTTWDEYVEAARKLHKADPKVYIANDAGDAGFTTSMLWQAGSRPYKVDGTNVTINFDDAGAKKYTATWQKLIDEKLVAPDQRLDRRLVQGPGRRHHRHPAHRRLDAGQLRDRREERLR